MIPSRPGLRMFLRSGICAAIGAFVRGPTGTHLARAAGLAARQASQTIRRPVCRGGSGRCAARGRVAGAGASRSCVVCVSSLPTQQFTGNRDSRQGRVCRVVGQFPATGHLNPLDNATTPRVISFSLPHRSCPSSLCWRSLSETLDATRLPLANRRSPGRQSLV